MEEIGSVSPPLIFRTLYLTHSTCSIKCIQGNIYSIQQAVKYGQSIAGTERLIFILGISIWKDGLYVEPMPLRHTSTFQEFHLSLHLSLNTLRVWEEGRESAMGITKPVSSTLSFFRFFSIVKTRVTYWISRSYFTGVATAQAEVTPGKYECDLKNLTITFSRQKISLIEKITNGTLIGANWCLTEYDGYKTQISGKNTEIIYWDLFTCALFASFLSPKTTDMVLTKFGWKITRLIAWGIIVLQQLNVPTTPLLTGTS